MSSITCVICSAAAPQNLVVFKKSDWICPTCNVVTLQEELHKIYNKGDPGRYLYVSELSNNLDKLHNYFVERVDMFNPFCSVTLVLPEAVGELKGAFDGVYVDLKCLQPSELAGVQLTQTGYIRMVEPTTQNVI